MPKPSKAKLIISHDSRTRLDAAAEWLNAFPPDTEVLVLSPTREAGDEFVCNAVSGNVKSETARARFGLLRMTLDRLAANLAAPMLAANARVPTTSLTLEALTARAVHLLVSEDALSYFAPVAKRPGFPRAAARTLDELRMNAVDIEAIRRLPRGGPDLAALAECVERELTLAKLADRSAVFEAAVEGTTNTSLVHPAGLPLLLLDLAVASTREAALIKALASRAPLVLATAARGDTRTIGMLQRALGCKAEEVFNVAPASSLVTLKTHLFEDSKPRKAALDESVTLSSSPGEARECVEIARRVQAEAARGIAFDRIAIFLRSTGEYRPHLEEAFRRAAVPAYFARGTTRPDPAGRALLALLECRAQDFSARRFAEYTSLSQVPDPDSVRNPEANWAPPPTDVLPLGVEPEPPGDEESETEVLATDLESTAEIAGTLRAPWRWERLLVESSVIGGKDRWKKRIEGLETEWRLKLDELIEEGEETRAAGLDRQIRDLEHLREFALPLIDKLAASPDRAIWAEWLAHLRQLAQAALRNAAGVLETLAELEPMSPIGPIDLYEVQLVLAPRLRELSVPPPRRRYGAVFIGSTDAARGMSFDVVFVPGLAEKLFPRKLIEDPILLDEQRRHIDGADLITQPSRVEAERLALRLAVGAASGRVHLSYPRIDVQQSRPRVPSFYGLEALRAAEGYLPGFDKLVSRAESGASGRLGWPAPADPKVAIDEAEYDLALLAPLIDADPETVAGTAHYLLSTNKHLGRALRARSRRWLKRWTPSDGLVEPDELARKALGAHQMSARSFSPTALQHYSACPYRFFLQAVHKLQPREEPAAIEVIDPLTRGSLFHKVQYEVLTMLREARLLPITPAICDQAIELVDDVLNRVASDYKERLAPAIPRVWEDGINAIRADLREWLRRASEADDGWVPYKFELGFGLADRGREDEDPASVAEPIPVVGKLKLRGSIDLVERHTSGKIRATDHKTGKARASDGVVVGGGEHLQPVLYALACEKLLGAPVESGRLYYCTTAGGFEERIVPLDTFSRGTAGIVVEIISSGLEEGFLPAAPEKGGCDWCDYRAVCGPFEFIRTSRKPGDRLFELKKLREMP
jgi:ATP-dependent helicase/nuclease subunit B